MSATSPQLLVPVFRDRLLGELGDGKPVRFDPGECHFWIIELFLKTICG